MTEPSADPARPRMSLVAGRYPIANLLAAAALGVLVVVGIVLAIGPGGALLDSEDAAERFKALGVWGGFAIIALMVVHCFVPFPAEILALAAGAAFGTLIGTALIWIGAMIGATLSFWLSRRLGRPFVEALLGPGGRAQLDRWSDDQGAMTLLISRLIPVIAFNLVNYAAGLTRVRLLTFVWTTGLGILPLTTLMVWLGAEMRTLSWPWLLTVSAGGILAITAGHRLARRKGWLGPTGSWTNAGLARKPTDGYLSRSDPRAKRSDTKDP